MAGLNIGRLVLSRKVGQSVEIGDDVTVRITKITGNKCRIEIDAPRHITVMRTELRTATEAASQRTEDSATRHAGEV